MKCELIIWKKANEILNTRRTASNELARQLEISKPVAERIKTFYNKQKRDADFENNEWTTDDGRQTTDDGLNF